jgi:hypothetical protein
MLVTLTDIYGGIISAGVLVNIWQVVSAKRAAVAAAGRAEDAATNAAAHAVVAAEAVAVVAQRVEEVHAATNGMKAALEDAAFARGRLEGLADHDKDLA